MDDRTKVITLPPKERVNLALAAVAGALAILVLLTAHDAFAPRNATPPAMLTAAPSIPAATNPAPAPAKGKEGRGGHD